SIGLVVGQSSEQLVWCNPGDLVAGAIEGCGLRTGAQLFYIIRVELIVESVGEQHPPPWDWTPIRADFDPAVGGAGDIECKTLEAGSRRLRDEFIVKQLIKAGDAEIEGVGDSPVCSEIET